MYYFIIILLIKFLSCINNDSLKNDKPNYLRFPFKTKIKSVSDLRDINNYFNESTFIDLFLSNNIFISISMGTPPQKVDFMVDQNEKCFSFEGNEELNNLQYKNNEYINYNIITPYNKKLWESSKQINKNELEEEFYLYQKINNNKEVILINDTTLIRFLYKNNDIGNTYGKIGFNMNNYEDISCPNFIKSLKNKNILQKFTYSFDFYSLFDGYLYLGPEPHFYNIKSNINKEYQYVKMNSILSKEGYFQWELLFNKIIIKNKTNNNYSLNLNEKSVKIDFNLGLIIGTDEYQEIIEQNFFNLLIEKNFCEKNLVDNKNGKYYVYSCNENLYQRIKRNFYTTYYDEFPEIEFFHQDLENSLKLPKHELFKEINGMYYFLIIFEVDKKNNVWKLGHPFLKQHQFIFDYDSKTIGYYDINIYQTKENKNKKSKDIEEIKINNNTNENTNINNNKVNNKNNFIFKNIYKYIIEIIIFVISIIFAVFIGMKIKESRKKRANELKDDDYEYTSHNNNVNNSLNKTRQNIELNKFGI